MRQFLACSFLLTVFVVWADGPADNAVDKVRPVPPPGAAISDDVRNELAAGASTLGREIEKLRADSAKNPSVRALLPDVEIFHKAVDWAVRYNEIFSPGNEVPAARNLLKVGSARLAELREGHPQWLAATGLVVRGYVSRLDGSVQPYGLVVPSSFQAGGPNRHRLDLWFHGRDEKLTELNFLAGRLKSYGEFTPRDTIVLHTYSRYCNGQKLAGEVDVFEALSDVQRNYPIDENRIVVRGFSLGGAACWQIAAHYPGRWAAAAPGAGFSETPEFLKVFQNETMTPAWYEQALWHQYNATDYALNFFNLPTVAYSGEIDRQKQAADAMAKAMRAEGLELAHVIGPKTEHRYHPVAKQEVIRRIDAIADRGRDPLPREIRFTTWTLRYNTSGWLTVDALEKHWSQARISAAIAGENTIRIQSANVSGLTLAMPPGACPFDAARDVTVVIDGKNLSAPRMLSDRSWTASFAKSAGDWKAGEPAGGLRKRHGLQGPIDDAFMDSFLVVRPTGRATRENVGSWISSELAHFTNEWRRQFRGDVRLKDDTAVTESDIAENHLILWGGPDSNDLLKRIAGGLPISWDAREVKVGNRTFAAADHVPAFIYPNPANPARYIVLNSGFTIREYDYLNNARQVPKLPDWAVIDISAPPSARWPGKIAEAGFFDEQWKLAE